MAKLVRLTARVAFSCAGRPIAAGETFEARAIDAAILLRKRQAVYAKAVPPTATPLEQKDLDAIEEPAEPRRRRHYRRRDMVAED